MGTYLIGVPMNGRMMWLAEGKQGEAYVRVWFPTRDDADRFVEQSPSVDWSVRPWLSEVPPAEESHHPDQAEDSE